jgi:hypothetical protein
VVHAIGRTSWGILLDYAAFGRSVLLRLVERTCQID